MTQETWITNLQCTLMSTALNISTVLVLFKDITRTRTLNGLECNAVKYRHTLLGICVRLLTLRDNSQNV